MNRSAAPAPPSRQSGAGERLLDALGTVLFLFLYVLGQTLLRSLFRVRVEGRCRVAPGEPVIVAANHASYLDPLFLQIAVPRRIRFLMTTAFFDIPLARSFFRLVGCLPVSEIGRAGNVATIRESARLLARGQMLGIFPEGGLSPDGSLQRGHSGVARLMLQTGVRALPVGIVGSFEVMSRPRPRLRLFRAVTIRIGEPISPPPPVAESGASESAARSQADELTRSLMESLARLTGGTLPSRPSPRATASPV